MLRKNKYKLSLGALALFMTGCASMPVFTDRASLADSIAYKAGFSKEYIKAGAFTLMTYQKFNQPAGGISIYIEGDGRAWATKHLISDDPTPSDPLALKLASEDPAGNVAYIARPGQYAISGVPDCDAEYWTSRRFAPEVLSSIDRVIDQLKEKADAPYVQLTGFSGGGAIAVLIAARRNDVNGLRTVAGNLDPKAFAIYHRVSQLDGSMDPMEVAQQVTRIPQRHFVGSMDRIVPLAILEPFVRMEGDKGDGRITVVHGATHHEGWYRHWRDLLSLPLSSH